VRTGHPLLDIGDDSGAVIFYTTAELCWQEIEIAPADQPQAKTHTEVTERLIGSRIIYTGVFPPLPVGDYMIVRPASRAEQHFGVAAGQVTEIDWRS
jgi:hypothetical protein